jgi:hypothetical protein
MIVGTGCSRHRHGGSANAHMHADRIARILPGKTNGSMKFRCELTPERARDASAGPRMTAAPADRWLSCRLADS